MLHVSETESSQETEGNVLVYRHHCLHHFVDFLAKLSVVLSLQYSSLTLMLHTWLKLGRFFPLNNTVQFTDPNVTHMAETGTFLPFE